mmetsp:Transcript_41961/g.98520  ORF Transcript_41961/g.98520 Transcript_41961/m.98520 type:complete len:243 (+) Transcript_41961:715-1443(+)
MQGHARSTTKRSPSSPPSSNATTSSTRSRPKRLPQCHGVTPNQFGSCDCGTCCLTWPRTAHSRPRTSCTRLLLTSQPSKQRSSSPSLHCDFTGRWAREQNRSKWSPIARNASKSFKPLPRVNGSNLPPHHPRPLRPLRALLQHPPPLLPHPLSLLRHPAQLSNLPLQLNLRLQLQPKPSRVCSGRRARVFWARAGSRDTSSWRMVSCPGNWKTGKQPRGNSPWQRWRGCSLHRQQHRVEHTP